MADYWYKLGQGSIVLRVKLRDTASAQAAGKTGLAYNTSGLNIAIIADNAASGTAYTAAGSTIEAVGTLGTYAAPTATKCRFSEVDATNHKGLYEIQIADAQFSVANAKSVAITIQCGTTIFERTIIIPLQQLDVYNAAPNVTATNAVAVGSFSKPTLDAGTYLDANFADFWANAASLGGTAVRSTTLPRVNNLSTLLSDIAAKTNLLNAGATGLIKADLYGAMGTAMTQAAGAGKVAGSLSKLLDVATPVFTAASANQTGDCYAFSTNDLSLAISDVTTVVNQIPSFANWVSGTDIEVALKSFRVAGTSTFTGAVTLTDTTTAGSLGKNIADLLARITSTLFSGITSLAHWLGAIVGKQTPNSTALTEIRATGAGSGTYEPDTDSLEALQIELGSGLLAMTDAFTAVKGATFDTATDSLEAIRDRGDAAWTTGAGGGGTGLTIGGSVALTWVDANGDPIGPVAFTITGQGSAWSTPVGTFDTTLPDGSYTVQTVRVPPILFADGTLVVSGGAGSLEIEGSAVPLTPSAPGLTTGYFYAYDVDNAVENGAEFQVLLLSTDGTAGRSFPRDLKTVLSDANGLVQVPDMLQSAVYQVRRVKTDGTYGTWTEVTTGTDVTTEMPEVLGRIG